MTPLKMLAPSILSADFVALGDQISKVESCGADWIHVDVMDGHFVPNLTMGPFIVAACRRATTLPLDVHLMVEEPARLIEPFARAGATSLTIHVEADPNLHRTLQLIRQQGCKVGVAINPGTPASALAAIVHLVDLILVMSVNPGYSGQAFLPEVLPKVKAIRQMLNPVNPHAMIEIDGGITSQTLPLAAGAGAQVFVAASAIFKFPAGIAAGMQALRESIP